METRCRDRVALEQETARRLVSLADRTIAPTTNKYLGRLGKVERRACWVACGVWRVTMFQNNSACLCTKSYQELPRETLQLRDALVRCLCRTPQSGIAWSKEEA